MRGNLSLTNATPVALLGTYTYYNHVFPPVSIAGKVRRRWGREGGVCVWGGGSSIVS